MRHALRRQLKARGPAAILELIPALPTDALAGATMAARDIDDPELRARALLAIRARTGSAARDDEILAAARAAGDARPELFFAWAAAEPGERGPQMLEACRAADRWSRGTMIADAVAVAAPETLVPLVEAAGSLSQDELVPVLHTL